MKSKLFHRLLSAFCAAVTLLALVPAAWAAELPAASNNQNGNCYPGGTGYYATTIKSYLFQNPSGGLTRVEYLDNQQIIAEDYSSSFQLQSSRTIPFELSKWGGFFAGEQYNFLIFGQDNPSESDSVEVLRVVKYDKSWNRLGQYSLNGGNISKPFEFGSLRCAEYDGYLYIHTCREMYKDSGGLNHQSNITLQIRESDMSKIQYVDTGITVDGYVSHSFNQFILVDSERNVVMLDQGDGTPRALVLIRPTTKAGPDPLGTPPPVSIYDTSANVPTRSEIWEYPGKKGENSTGSTTGDLAETRTGYVTAYNRDDVGSGWASRKIYLGYTDKSTLTSRCTQISPDKAISTPQLAPTGLDGGWLLWNGMDKQGWHTDDTLHYVPYYADGTVGEEKTWPKAPLSDCHPIQYNGKTVWYVTNDSAPVFYTLDASGVTATPANGSAAVPDAPAASAVFSDVPASHWAYQDIMGSVSLGAVAGFHDGTFRPAETVTIPQFCIMVERAVYPDLLAEYQAKTEYAGKPWYVPVCDMAWLGAPNTAPALFHYADINYSEANHSNDWSGLQNQPLNRFNMALMLDTVVRYEKRYGTYSTEEKDAVLSAIVDYDEAAWGYVRPDAVARCIMAGIINGMPDGTFSGEQTVTRAQACAVINRLYRVLNG